MINNSVVRSWHSWHAGLDGRCYVDVISRPANLARHRLGSGAALQRWPWPTAMLYDVTRPPTELQAFSPWAPRQAELGSRALTSKVDVGVSVCVFFARCFERWSLLIYSVRCIAASFHICNIDDWRQISSDG